ncbi:hypothetical protein DFH09DRAFT_1378091 [Mycena vulgaris]|nr:hypothetical protein DFH09DRAFT_1378091 [Mycena vulgaris]
MEGEDEELHAAAPRLLPHSRHPPRPRVSPASTVAAASLRTFDTRGHAFGTQHARARDGPSGEQRERGLGRVRVRARRGDEWKRAGSADGEETYVGAAGTLARCLRTLLARERSTRHPRLGILKGATCEDGWMHRSHHRSQRRRARSRPRPPTHPSYLPLPPRATMLPRLRPLLLPHPRHLFLLHIHIRDSVASTLPPPPIKRSGEAEEAEEELAEAFTRKRWTRTPCGLLDEELSVVARQQQRALLYPLGARRAPSCDRRRMRTQPLDSRRLLTTMYGREMEAGGFAASTANRMGPDLTSVFESPMLHIWIHARRNATCYTLSSRRPYVPPVPNLVFQLYSSDSFIRKRCEIKRRALRMYLGVFCGARGLFPMQPGVIGN